jgi:hypothetical protein
VQISASSSNESLNDLNRCRPDENQRDDGSRPHYQSLLLHVGSIFLHDRRCARFKANLLSIEKIPEHKSLFKRAVPGTVEHVLYRLLFLANDVTHVNQTNQSPVTKRAQR